MVCLTLTFLPTLPSWWPDTSMWATCLSLNWSLAEKGNIQCQLPKDTNSSPSYPHRPTRKHLTEQSTYISHLHLRYGCKCEAVLKHTQTHVEGLNIQQGTLKGLAALLPCSACLAKKMRKTNKQPHKNFTEVNNLITNAPLSWTPSTADKAVNPNHTVSLDWDIVNKRNKTGHYLQTI